ncbi:MFS transporter [Streptomyces sp. NPDC051001]|uniref:MFS transporter n=1 Tax=Streptomyces sp. NPDC051001 TaxID=3155795 RepID=UPI003440182D
MTDRKIHQVTHSPSVAAPAGSQALLAVLACLTAVGPLAIDMYIPGFPAMSRTLHTSGSAVQLTRTAFLAGVVVGQIVIGPVSDSLGRRGLLIGGCPGFAVVALACAFASGIWRAHRRPFPAGSRPCRRHGARACGDHRSLPRPRAIPAAKMYRYYYVMRTN